MIFDSLIPARAGSKRIPGKNKKIFRGKPLIAWSIDLARQEEQIRDVYVSTDSGEIAEIAEKYGAKIIKRPTEISGDFSTDYECFDHFLKNLTDLPDAIVHLRPTYPIREPQDLKKMLELAEQDCSCVRSAIPTEHPPFKTYTKVGEKLVPLVEKLEGVQRPYDCPTQLLPETYRGNGYIDIVKRRTIELGSVSGDNILPYVMSREDIFDIDTYEDWERAELAERPEMIEDRKLCEWVGPKNDMKILDGVKRRLLKSFESNHFANGGPCVRELEELIRDALKIDDDRAVVAVCNGTVAIQMAAQAIDHHDGIKRKWCTQAFTFPPSAQGYLRDSEIIDMCDLGGPDLQQIPTEVSGTVVTNIFGNVADIEQYELWRTGKKRLIFDNAATPYTFYKGKNSLNYGDAATISFHHTKPLGFGEGGAVIIRKEYEEALRMLINFGIGNNTGVYWLPEGTNGKMSDIQAAFIAEHMRRLPEMVASSMRGHARLAEIIKKAGGKLLSSYHDPAASRLLPCVCALLPNSRKIVSELNVKGVMVRKYYHVLGKNMTYAEGIYDDIVCFPCHGNVSAECGRLIERAITRNSASMYC